MQEKSNKFDEALESLIQAKAILEDNYGVVDKRTTRVKRNISLIRLKLGMIPDALQEMKEVEVSQAYPLLLPCPILLQAKSNNDKFVLNLGIGDDFARGPLCQYR